MSLHLTLFADIDPSPRKTWLVSRFLGDGEMSCFFGPPGSGKSVLVGDLAAHIAAGLPWLGRAVTQGAVLYVAAERAALVRRRLAAWRLHHGIDELPLAVLAGAIDLRSSRASAEEIAGHAGDLRDLTGQLVRLIAIDTVSRALNGGDENSPKDMGALVGNVSTIQAITGAHVLLAHHVPQDGNQRMRGHGALLGAVDTSVSVEKGASARSATVDKQNDGDEGEAVGFTLESVELVPAEAGGDATTAPVVVASDMPANSAKQHRRLPDRVKVALDVLRDVCLDGKPVPGLPNSVRGIQIDTWRDALYSRGALDPDHRNPREDFRRVKGALQARQLAAEKDGLIWAV